MTSATPSARSVPYRVSVGVGTGSLLQPLNSSMIAVALIAIGSQLSITAGLSWLISALYLATAVGAPTAGRLADLFGARKVYFAGLVLVALGGLLGGLVSSLPGLILARVVLGLGTASQYPAAMAIIRARARRYEEDATRALAVLGVCAQVSVAFGPTLGGVLVAGLGWRWIFWINLPLTALSGLWVWRATEPDERRPARSGSLWGRLDVAGLALFAAALSFSMLFLMSLPDKTQWWALMAVVPLALGWVWRERRAGEPFLDLRMLARHPRLLVIFARQLLVSTAFYSVFYVLPQWLGGVRGYQPDHAGLLILPIAGIGVFSTLAASVLIRRGHLFLTLLVGTCGLIAAGLLIASLLTRTTPSWGLLGVAVMLGVPNGFNNQANQNELYAAAGRDIGAASGLLRTTQYVGANLSAAMLEVLLAGPATDAGLHRVGLGITAVSVLLLAVTLAGWWRYGATRADVQLERSRDVRAVGLSPSGPGSPHS
jgi:MFS family permease